MEHERRSWDVNRPISGVAFLLTGLALMAVKLGVDWSIAHFGFGRPWSFLHYFNLPGSDFAGRVLMFQRDSLPGDERRFAFCLLLACLPFVTVGVVLTLRRLRTVGLPVGLLIFFFLPWINLLFFPILALVPARFEDREAEALRDRAITAAGGIVAQRVRRLTALAAVALGATIALVMVWLGVYVVADYGLGIFVGAPFLLGFAAAMVAGSRGPCALGECMLLALWSLLLVGLVLVLFAMEGLGCLVMALPIAAALAFLGTLLGWSIRQRSWSSRRIQALFLALLALAPALMAMEATSRPEPKLRAVVTSVIVDAPPEEVWRFVIAFPPIPERRESWLASIRDGDAWLFRAGIAEPRSAEIVGTGVGAVRHCVFSTGAFVEPIVVWDPPRLLRFDVTDQPPTMREWSPYDIHPPHLEGFLVSRQGQFELTPLDDGRTRLVGTTWYTNAMWPASYWALWSDAMIHAIHRRVLGHIASLAE